MSGCHTLCASNKIFRTIAECVIFAGIAWNIWSNSRVFSMHRWLHSSVASVHFMRWRSCANRKQIALILYAIIPSVSLYGFSREQFIFPLFARNSHSTAWDLEYIAFRNECQSKIWHQTDEKKDGQIGTCCKFDGTPNFKPWTQWTQKTVYHRSKRNRIKSRTLEGGHTYEMVVFYISQRKSTQSEGTEATAERTDNQLEKTHYPGALHISMQVINIWNSLQTNFSFIFSALDVFFFDFYTLFIWCVFLLSLFRHFEHLLFIFCVFSAFFLHFFSNFRFLFDFVLNSVCLLLHTYRLVNDIVSGRL